LKAIDLERKKGCASGVIPEMDFRKSYEKTLTEFDFRIVQFCESSHWMSTFGKLKLPDLEFR